MYKFQFAGYNGSMIKKEPKMKAEIIVKKLTKLAEKTFGIEAANITVEPSEVVRGHWNVECDWDGEGNYIERHTYAVKDEKFVHIGVIVFEA